METSTFKSKRKTAIDEPDPASTRNGEGRESVSLTLNVPFRGSVFIANKTLTQQEREQLEAVIPEEEPLLFVVVGDLSRKNRYARCLLAVTDWGLYAADDTFEGLQTYGFHQIKQSYVKRYYGNAVLRLTMTEDEKTVNFLRFSYRQATLFDVAAAFISAMAGEGVLQEELDAVEASFEKQFCVCPKCGRTLLRPGAPCVKCESKDKLFQKLGRYVWPYRKILLFCLLLSMISTAFSLLPPYMTQILVDEVLPDLDKNKLLQCTLTLLLTHTLLYTIGTFRSYLLRINGDKIVADLRRDVYEKAQHLPLYFYDKTSTGSVINRISGDSTTIQSFVLRITQEVLTQALQLVGIGIIMFALNWKMALLALIPVPIVVYGNRIYGKRVWPLYRRNWRRWAAVTNVMTDTIPGIRVIKAFARERKSTERFAKANEAWRQNAAKTAKITTLHPNIMGYIAACGNLLIWAVGGSWVIRDSSAISAGLLISFISYAGMFYSPLTFFANLNDAYQGFLSAAERLMDIIDAEPEHDFGKGQHPEKLKGKIEFRDVNFSFDRTKKTLTNINFVIEPGDVVGIVGTTGAGKSTLINLLMRFYDHYEGQILVDDTDIRDIDLAFYRSELGYVQQEPMMFHDTIYHNIAYGCDDVSVEDVIRAADVANAHCFIARLPDGYDTLLGERGVGLSGGERQRLSIARAVLKNPSILLFDEATASVDSETESQIQEAIENLIQGRTTLMIAHRLSTLRKANKIIVVDRGKILEMGTPEELLALKGKYYKLIEIQTMSAQVQKEKEEERLA